MSDSAADELGDMLLVIKQRHAELVELQTAADSLLKAIGAERRKLDNERRDLARSVSVAVESEVSKAQTGLESQQSAVIQQVRGMVEKAKKTALNTVLWALGVGFLVLLAFFTVPIYLDSGTFAKIDRWGDAHELRIQAIENRLKIKK